MVAPAICLWATGASRALLAALDLLLHREEVIVVVDLHRVALRPHVAGEHLLPLLLHARAQLLLRRERVPSGEKLRDPLTLRLGERHDRAEWLEEPDEHQALVRRVEDAHEQRKVVVLRLEEAAIEEGERDAVARAIDD